MNNCCGFYLSEYEYGLKWEQILHPVFNDIFNKEFKDTDKFCVYDFFKDNIYIELKSRKIKKDAFPTTIVGMYKINHTKSMVTHNPNKEYYYFFKFIDDDEHLYYWKYNEEDMEDWKITNIQRRDRKNKKPVPHLNIPIDKLTKIKYTDNI